MAIKRQVRCVFFWQLGALLYKNVILGFRLWKGTLCHLLIPMIMVIIFGAISAATATNGEVRVPSPLVEFSSSANSDISRGLPKCRIYDVTGGKYGNGVPFPNVDCVTLAYAPTSNPEVVRIMTKLAELNSVTHSTNSTTIVDVMGFLSNDSLIEYALANPGILGSGVIFPDTLIINLNATVDGGEGIPTIPIEVLYNNTVVGKFAGTTGDDLLYSTVNIVSTPLQVYRAVVEAILAIHTNSPNPDVSFDVRKFPLPSTSNGVSSSLDDLVGIFVYLGVMIPFILTLRQVVAEKENNLLDSMRMTGLLESAYWLSWFLYFAFTSLISTTLMYFAGTVMGTPIFVNVDSNIIFQTLYFYFLATLSLALALSTLIATTKLATMVGFCFLALGVMVEVMFSIAPLILDLVYNPYIIPTPALQAINLYPPVLFSKMTTDFSTTILPYLLPGTQTTVRNQYTQADFVDGFYRYGTTTSPLLQSQLNFSTCILNPDSLGTQSLVTCYSQAGACPTIHGSVISPCPTVACSNDWGQVYSTAESCQGVGGVLVNGVCQCRYVTASNDDNLTNLIWLIALYFAIAWYCGQIFTYGHGRSEPFYFPLLPWYWFPSLKRKSKLSGVYGIAKDADVLREERDIQAGMYDSRPVLVTGLKKIFGGKFTAVNGLSFSIEKGTCFALLGHNGAGKTTAIKMLSGLTSLTDGDILVHGVSIRDSLSAVRHEIGACP